MANIRKRSSSTEELEKEIKKPEEEFQSPLLRNPLENATLKRNAKEIPKFIFSAMFVFQIILGLIKTILSGLWHHWLGLILSLALMAAAAIGLFLLWRYSTRGYLWKGILIIGSFLTAFLVILLAFQIISWDSPIDSFPNGCKRKTNCTRVTTIVSSNVRGVGLTCPMIQSSTVSIHDQVKSWVESQSQSVVMEDSNDFIHARIVSALWGFADDFYAQLKCLNNGTTAIWVQSEARFGYGDMGVNDNRVSNFIHAIDGSGFPKGSCSSQ